MKPAEEELLKREAAEKDAEALAKALRKYANNPTAAMIHEVAAKALADRAARGKGGV